MRTHLLAVAILVGSFTVVQADPAEPRREIEATNKAMTVAFERGDLAAVARFYADDARIIGPGSKAVQDRKAVDEYWLRIKNGKSWKLEVLEVGGSLDQPWQLGRSTLVTTANGKDQTSIVDFILLWRRQKDGKLKIYVDMYVPTPKS
jgi:ketosteroid isomerase-like protein